MRGESFIHFRLREDRGAIDLILLQETHVAVGEADTMDKLYHRKLGFVQESVRTILTEAAAPWGGFATLLHPYSSIRTLDSWQEDLLTRHWMAFSITHQEESILVINVYSPTDKGDLEDLFDYLRHQIAEHYGLVLMGGDFNCTLHPRIDRSYVLWQTAMISQLYADSSREHI